jgi:MYXO-CTERM domain-containing protein
MRQIFPILILLAATGCANTTFVSDEGQLRFETSGVTAGEITDVDPRAGAVLEGTLFCATVCREGNGDCATDTIAFADECFTDTLEGPASFEGTCVRFDAAGDVRWAWEPEACSQSTDHVADGVDFQVVAAADVTARRAFPMDEYVLDAIAASPFEDGSAWSTGDGEVPDDLLPADDEPVLWMVDGAADASVAIETPDGRPVIWTVADGAITLVADEGPDPDVAPNGSASILVEPSAPGGGEILFSVGAEEWSLGRWEAVPERDADSLEIVVVYGEDATQKQPLGARAVIRDEDGRPIFGANVDWGVDGGPMAVGVSDEGAGDRSYANLDGAACIRPSEREGTHSAVLQARLGGLSDEVEVTWELAALGYTDEQLAEADATWTPPESCLEPLGPACGCATGAPSGALAALLAAAVGLGRRRIRR